MTAPYLMPDDWKPPRFQWLRNTTVIARGWVRGFVQAKLTRIPNDLKDLS